MERIHGNHSSSQVRTDDYRAHAEILRSRVELLDGADRELMLLYFDAGLSLSQLSRLTGLCEGTVSRKIRRLSRRLASNEYLFCCRHKERFSKWELMVAKNYFARGISIRKIAMDNNRSYYQVWKTVDRIKDFIDRVRKGGLDVRSNRIN